MSGEIIAELIGLNPNSANLLVAIVALLVSIVSFGFAARTWGRKRKEDKIKNLLGDKESIAYAALRLLPGGFPRGKNERATTINAIQSKRENCSLRPKLMC